MPDSFALLITIGECGAWPGRPADVCRAEKNSVLFNILYYYVMIKEMLSNKISVNYFEPLKRGTHYEVTPYAFTPKLGKKLVNNPYIDMGQGLLELMDEIYNDLNKKNGFEEIIINSENE